MEYYREYIEIGDPDDGGPPYVAEVRLCHEFPVSTEHLPPGNRVISLDDRVPVSAAWDAEDMPTETWNVLSTAV